MKIIFSKIKARLGKLFTKKTKIKAKKGKSFICECGYSPQDIKTVEENAKIYTQYECICGKVIRKLEKNIIYL